MKRYSRPAVWLAALLIFSGPIWAQEEPAPDPAPTNPQLSELEEQNKLLEEQIKLLENRRKLAEAKYGGSDVEPLSGEITAEGDTPIESKFLAHEALQGIAAKIADGIGDVGKDKPLVVYSQAEYDAIVFYQAFLEQLKIVEEEYRRVLEEPEVEPSAEAALLSAAVTGVLSAVAEVASFFRSDVTVKSAEFELDELALVSALASRMAGSRQVYHPALLSPDFLGTGKSKLLGKLEDLRARRLEADLAVAERKRKKGAVDKKIAGLDKQIKEKAEEIKKEKNATLKAKLQKEKQQLEEQKQPEAKESKRLGGQIERLEKVNQLYLSLAGTLVAADSDAGVEKLRRLLRAERLQTKLAEGGYSLRVAILAAGGSTKTSNNLFTGSRLRHSGGALAAYLLFDDTGAVERAGSFAVHSGQRAFKSWESQKQSQRKKSQKKKKGA